MENQEEKAPENQELTTIELIEKVKDTEEFKTLVKNNAKQYIGGELKTVYSTLDGVIKDSLGLDKPEDIKTSQWLKQNLSKLTEASNELDVLKTKGDNNNEEQTKLWQQKFDKLNKLLKDKEEEIKTVSQKGFENNVNNQIDTFLVGKNFKVTYSDDDVKTLVSSKKDKITSNTRVLENGKVAVWNPDKQEYYTDTLGEPLTPTQVADKLFSTMFQVKTKGGNASTEDTPTSIEGDILNIDMNKINTRGEFYDAFNEKIALKGLPSHSDEYKKIQKLTMAHYKIAELPLS